MARLEETVQEEDEPAPQQEAPLPLPPNFIDAKAAQTQLLQRLTEAVTHRNIEHTRARWRRIFYARSKGPCT